MKKVLTPERLLMGSFAAAILIGSILLSLPAATKHGKLSYIDALFTSTSAVCVTGLIVKDTAKDFTLFGQSIILFLFQLGGLGIMTFSSVILLLTGRGVSVLSRTTLQQSFSPVGIKDFKTFLKDILIYTFSFELFGALLLFTRFASRLDPFFAAFASIFHAVSAFCNAGFSVFSDSLMGWRGDIVVNLTMMFLIVMGGAGFFVFWDIKERVRGKRKRFSLHSKIVVLTTTFLITLGATLIFLLENKKSFSSFTLKEKILASLFQAITPRTAGFNTVDISALSLPTLLLIIGLMFIGASPGSTGGGVKTTTAFLGYLSLRRIITRRKQVQVFSRGIRDEVMERALVLLLFFLTFHFSATFLLAITERFSYIQLAFEEMSAMGTVGLSMGITSGLSPLGKIIIIISMYLGRVGPLTVLTAMIRRSRGRFSLPYENVMIG